MTTIDVERLPAALADDLDAAFPDVVRALQNDVFSGAWRMTRDRTGHPDDGPKKILQKNWKSYRI